jgi:hypothetical protein
MNCTFRVLIVLAVASLGAGCNGIRFYQIQSAGAENLNAMDKDWEYSRESGSLAFPGYVNTYASYRINSTHLSIISPASASPSTTAGTSAVLVNGPPSDRSAPSRLVALEFGEGGTLTNTEAFSGVPWASKLQSTETPLLAGRLDAPGKFVADASNDNVLGWGRWTSNQFTNAGTVQAGCCNNNKSAHYVFGAATPNANIPNTGVIATFNLIGATSPTISDGSSAPGTLNAGTVAVAFNGASASTLMGVNLAGTLGGLPFTVRSVGTTAAPSIPYDPVTRSFTMTGSSVDGSSVSGFLAGPAATHVGLTYAAQRGSDSIQGAAAFKR